MYIYIGYVYIYIYAHILYIYYNHNLIHLAKPPAAPKKYVQMPFPAEQNKSIQIHGFQRVPSMAHGHHGHYGHWQPSFWLALAAALPLSRLQ